MKRQEGDRSQRGGLGRVPGQGPSTLGPEAGGCGPVAGAGSRASGVRAGEETRAVPAGLTRARTSPPDSYGRPPRGLARSRRGHTAAVRCRAGEGPTCRQGPRLERMPWARRAGGAAQSPARISVGPRVLLASVFLGQTGPGAPTCLIPPPGLGAHGSGTNRRNRR